MKPEAFRTQLSPLFVAESLGITLPGMTKVSNTSYEGLDIARPFTTVTTDSRQVAQGCLFVALKGDKFDGHDFIPQAIEMGARGVICRRDYPVPMATGTKVFAVDDTLDAYRRLAARWRKEFPIPVVAVAGSVGKTTTKELLAAILSGKFPKVLKTTGSQNGFVGIPMTLLELRPEHGAAVIEVGIDDIGAMEGHMQVVGATAAVLTAIGAEHLENLRDIPTVAREEGLALAAVARTGGVVAINLDDPWVRPFAATLRSAKRICYSLKDAAPPSSVSPEQILRGKLSDGGNALTLSGLGFDGLELSLPLLGAHNAQNLLAAVAVAAGLGLTPQQTAAGLVNFKGAYGRSELQELPGGTRVVCDYYNANPNSVEAGLDLLTQVARAGGGSAKTRRACLADMLELGSGEETMHRELAAKIVALAVEHVLLYGPRMKWLEAELKARGFRGKLAHYPTQADLAEALISEMQPGDAILIKGSRSMKMEEVWKLLQAQEQSQSQQGARGSQAHPG